MFTQMNSIDRLRYRDFPLIMTNTKGLATIIAISAILITGTIGLSPYAYSTGSWNHDDDDDKFSWDNGKKISKDWDKDWKKHKDDDCKCEKPTKFTVIYNGPGMPDGTGDNAEVTIEVYKKTDYIGDEDKILQTITGVYDGKAVTIDSNTWGGKKVESNTVYHVKQNDAAIATISIHTSCSQDLFIGDMYSDGPVTLTVDSGEDYNGMQSVFYENDPICEGATLTVTKVTIGEVDGNEGNFVLHIDGENTNLESEEVQNGGTFGPHLLPVGIYTISETAGTDTNLAEYSTSFGGACKEDGTVELKKGKESECIITNTVKIPATITLKKALTNDNGGDALPDDFEVTLTNVGADGELGGIDDMTQEIERFNAIEPSMGVINFEIPAGTYAFNEKIAEDSTATSIYTTVLFAGDTACPSMEDEEFTLEEGQHITCTIYNDDNFVEGGAAGPKPTVTFEVVIIDADIGIVEDGPVFQVGDDIEITYRHGGFATIDANVATTISQVSDGIDGNEVEILPTKITGDGNCPEVLTGQITLSSGQDITCVFEYGKVIEPGVVFHYNNLMFNQGTTDLPDECPMDLTSVSIPCVVSDGSTTTIYDPALETTTTIILFDFLTKEVSFQTQALGCGLDGLVDSGATNLDTGNHILGFVIKCSQFEPFDPDLDNDSTNDVPYDEIVVNVNYAFIETVRPNI